MAIDATPQEPPTAPEEALHSPCPTLGALSPDRVAGPIIWLGRSNSTIQRYVYQPGIHAALHPRVSLSPGTLLSNQGCLGHSRSYRRLPRRHWLLLALHDDRRQSQAQPAPAQRCSRCITELPSFLG